MCIIKDMIIMYTVTTHIIQVFSNLLRDADEGVTDKSLTLFLQRICNTKDRESLVKSPTRKTMALIHSLSKYLQSTYHMLTRQTFVGKVMSLLFNMLSRLVITFLPRSKCLFNSWLQSPSAVILEPKKMKSHCFHCFPIYWMP